MRLQLTNDAFFTLYAGDEPIDETNLEEANRIAAQFPGGFTIADDWVVLGDTGLIEATFMENRVRPSEYTHSLELFNGWELLISINGQIAKYMFWHPLKEPFKQGTSLLDPATDKIWIDTGGGKYPLASAKRL